MAATKLTFVYLLLLFVTIKFVHGRIAASPLTSSSSSSDFEEVLPVALASHFDYQSPKTIVASPDDNHRGDWAASAEFCPEGSIVTGFDILYMHDQGSLESIDNIFLSAITLGMYRAFQELTNVQDDYGVIAVTLQCTDLKTKKSVETIKSLSLPAKHIKYVKASTDGGTAGQIDWSYGGLYNNVNSCPNKSPAIGFQVKIQPPQGAGDDVAVTNFKLICDGNKFLPDPPIVYTSIYPDKWSEPIFCPEGHAVCGIQTKIHTTMPDVDNEGLTNLRLRCCKAVDEMVVRSSPLKTVIW